MAKMRARRLASLALALAGLMAGASPLRAEKNSCLECHEQLEDQLRAPALGMAQDVHRKYGLSCANCHGGNPKAEDMDLAKDRTFRGVPDRKRIPDLCGSCHADADYIRKFNPNLRVDQLALYRTSRHGRLLAEGDVKVAVCTDCHGVHGILPATMPKSAIFPWNVPKTCGRCHSDPKTMEAYRIPTNQVEEYMASVHAQALFEKKDLAAPVCNSCHGDHGALPPSVTSIAYVCRQCHASTGELFSRSPHKAAFDELGEPECEVCHGHHKIVAPTDALIGAGPGAVCVDCHDPGSKPYQAAVRIKGLLDEYVGRMAEARARLDAASAKGVEVSEARYRLREADTALIEVRNLTHGLSLRDIVRRDRDGQVILDQVLKEGDQALREAKTRRTGLVVATIFLALLAAALFLKSRQISARRSGR
jgi:predicted CXXCH cytochrome family protein